MTVGEARPERAPESALTLQIGRRLTSLRSVHISALPAGTRVEARTYLSAAQPEANLFVPQSQASIGLCPDIRRLTALTAADRSGRERKNLR
jgi:hypothetical protein